MRVYETVCVLNPDLVGDAYQEQLQRLKGILEQNQAEVQKQDEWGTKKLAYAIDKQPRGTYVRLVFAAEADKIFEWERRLRQDENVLKFLTVKLEKGEDQAKETAGPAPATAEEETSAEAAVDEPEEEL